MAVPHRLALGKRRAIHDTRTLQLAAYLPRAGAVPDAVDWTRHVASWPMLRNDVIGCCTVASAAHMVHAWSAERAAATPTAKDHAAVLSDSVVERTYRVVSGYRPEDPSTDRGAVLLDVLKLWRKKGIGGHTVGAFASVEIQNRPQLVEALAIFGGIYAGLDLPLSAQDQRIWEVPPGHGQGTTRGSWGGHAVPILAADRHGLTVVTWGALKRMSWPFWKAYGDEAYALISPDFLIGKTAVSGVDIAALRADLAALDK